MSSIPTKLNAVVLVSGGIDSTLSVRFYQKMGYVVRGMFVDFGQRARLQEKRALARISKSMGIAVDTVNFTGIRATAGKVVGRNAVFVATALMKYPSLSGILALGIHGGTRYEDCSQSFLDQMQRLADLYTDGRVRLGAPLIEMNKREVFEYARRLRVPIALTYSCEKGSPLPCGKCQSCIDRAALFDA
jgi:7-cyano-7-deazaguanine synthase